MAILNRFFKGIIPGQSFRRYLFYAFGEVILIFAGITLSIWFSNWNDRQKAREIEVKLLKEFRAGLLHDLEDVNFNMSSKKASIAACLRIIDLMNNPLPYHDSLDRHFSTALELTVTQGTESAYESLKAMGVHTITNDSLRIAIVNLYDVSYPSVHSSEARHGDLFFNFLVGFNAERFDTSNPYGVMKPLNYRALMADQQYKYYLNILIFYNSFIWKQSSEIADEIKRLIKRIDDEIANPE